MGKEALRRVAGGLGEDYPVVRGFGLGAVGGCHVGPHRQGMIDILLRGLLLWVRYASDGAWPLLLH